MKITQNGDYTVYTHDDHMGDDVLVRPHVTQGAEVIHLCSLFMDYGHFLAAHEITEEEYKELQALKPEQTEEINAFFDKVYPHIPE